MWEEDKIESLSLPLASSQTSSINESYTGRPTSECSSQIDTDLTEKRQLIQELIKNNNTGKEGDTWYIIPTEYLEKFLNSTVTTLEQLKKQLGPIDCSSIVDENGNSYPENQEPVGTSNISPEIFNYLSKWLGIVGEPITRYLILNPETNEIEVERFPPVFYVHQLGKKAPSTSASYYARSHNTHQPPIPIIISRTNRFADLIDSIRVKVLKSPKSSQQGFRIWFINSKNINDIPCSITLANFCNDIPSKTLVHAGLLKETIKSQGINSNTYHVMVELLDSKNKFPIDLYWSQVDLDNYDVDHLLSKCGSLGLSNLGNTCYMNSALQCLLHIPEINYYFFYNLYKRELNSDNPLGNHGDVANSFGALLRQAFDSSSSAKSSSSIAPREFKSTIGRYSSMFSGYMQQDSQEFLSWLLDALHEDLNRIYKKPYSEKPELKDEEVFDPQAIIRLAETCWDQHKKRNDSVIIDLFTGLYQSTLICPTCSKTSITFDPFNDLTLPLPISKKWYHSFTVVDLSDEGMISGVESRIVKLEVELNKNSNYDELIKYLSKFLNVSKHELFLYEIFRNSFYSDFQLDYNKNKFMPIGDIIRESDEVHVYYIPHDPVNDIIVPVFNSVENPDKSYNVSEMFGIPLFLVLDKETEVMSFGSIRKKLEEKVKILTKLKLTEEYDNLKTNSENFTQKTFYNRKDFPFILNDVPPSNADDNKEIKGTELKLDEDDEGYNSDISLANPYVGANIGFTIKYAHEAPQKTTNTGFRQRFNIGFGKNSLSNTERMINAPLNKPNFNDFKPLADELPDLKRKYYHYTDYGRALDQEMEDLAEEVNNDMEAQEAFEANRQDEEKVEGSSGSSDSTSKTREEDGFVLVEHSNSTAEDNLAPKSTISLSDEDTESDQPLGSSLYGSSSTALAIPPPSTFSDFIKHSNENSPAASSVSSPSRGENNHPTLVTKNTILLCDWDPSIYQQFFEDELTQNWENVPFIPNPELEHNKVQFERQRNSKVSLYNCLKDFSTPEVLGEHDLWYCPKCKDHKQATKSIQLWSTGDILTIHLKRFHSARAFSDKIDIVVDFPIEGLDISPFIANPESSENIYDLIAVDNHYGGLGGGHYTASAKNFRDNNWYYFNDSRVTKIEDPQECVSNAAYLLFYRKRKPLVSEEEEFLGGESLNSLLKNGRELYKNTLINKKKCLEQVFEQLKTYTESEENLRKEGELNDELEKTRNELEQQNSEEDDGDIEDESDDDKEEDEVEPEASTEKNENLKKSRLFDTAKLADDNLNKAQFNLDADEDLDYEDDLDNNRKQRLISKEKNSNKLIQIKSNRRHEMTSSPVLSESNLENDNINETIDSISEVNGI